MAYSFDQIFAVDPANPSNVAQNASVTIFAPGDGTMTPIAITDPDGQPLANPLTVNANGFGSAFAHATLDRVAWAGGGFTGFFTSYEGMKAEAVAAREAAETAATTAGADAAAVATAAIGDATADAEAAALAAEASAASAANAASAASAPTDTAMAAAVNNPASATKTALNATYVGRSEPYISALDYGAVADGNLSTGGGTDNTAALAAGVAAAIASNKPLFIPAGVYRTVNMVDLRGARVYGHGVNKTYIMCTDVTKNVVTVGGGGAYLADMTIQHFALPDASVVVPNGVGIRVQKLGDRSVLERLHIRNVTSGIYSYEPVGDTTNYIYSTRISDIRVERFTHSAAYLRGSGAGNTGCMFENLYAQNGNGDGTYVTATHGWYFGEFDEGSAHQVNIEWGFYGTGITVFGCQGFRITNVHFEQYRAKGGSFNSHFNIVGSSTRNTTISGVTIKNCIYDIANIPDYALVRIQDANAVVFENVVATGATVTGSPNMVKYRFAPAVEGAHVIPRNIRMLDGTFGTETYYQSALTTTGVRVLTTPPGASMFEESGGMRWKTPNATILTLGGDVKAVSTNYTVTAGDLFVLATSGGGGITVTLPAATKGGRVTIKKVDAGAGAVTVATTSSQTIDGATTKSLPAQYDKIAVVSDGTAWFTL